MVDIYINASVDHKALNPEHFENSERILNVQSAINADERYSSLIRIPNKKSEHEKRTLIEKVHTSHIFDYLSRPDDVICQSCGNGYTISDECPNCGSTDQIWFLGNDTDEDVYVNNKTKDHLMENIDIFTDAVDRVKSGNKYEYLLVRPPGHHCYNKGMGFCPINNDVIMAFYAREQGFKRIFILDYDYHHGDGTAKLVDGEEGIFALSMHAFSKRLKVYPGTGSEEENTANTVNIPLMLKKLEDRKKIYTDKKCIGIYEERVLPIINNYNPDLIIIANGMDMHFQDKLEGLAVTDEFYKHICRSLKALNVPLIYSLQGGYTPETIKRVSLSLIDILLEEPRVVELSNDSNFTDQVERMVESMSNSNLADQA